MTTTTRNEAAERLLLLFDGNEPIVAHLHRALAAERRATVERIRERVIEGFAVVEDYDAVIRILDEEAAR